VPLTRIENEEPVLVLEFNKAMWHRLNAALSFECAINFLTKLQADKNRYPIRVHLLTIDRFQNKKPCCIKVENGPISVICEPSTFAGTIFHFLEIFASLMLVNYKHQTGWKKHDGLPFSARAFQRVFSFFFFPP